MCETYVLIGEDYTTLTTPLMEAMVLVGLSLGTFVKGKYQIYCEREFCIKFVSDIESRQAS